MANVLQETGVVSFIKDDYAYLKTNNASACSSCASKGSCGNGDLKLTNVDYAIRVPNDLNLKQGDEVVLDISSDRLLFGTFLVYLLPLFFLFLFAGLAQLIGGDLLSAISGLIGLLIGLFMANRIISVKRIARQFEPKVSEKTSRII